MLKIKDNVDLKELEKFGFILNNCKNHYSGYEFYDDLHRSVIYINIELRIVEYTIGAFQTDSPLDILFDLIQAELVEKVEVDNG